MKKSKSKRLSGSFKDFLAEPVRNGVYKEKEFHGRGQKIVNMGELFAYNFIADQEMKRVELNKNEVEKSLLQDGDLLFARRSLVLEGSGKCSLVTSLSEPTTFESSIIRGRLNQAKADPRYFFYYFTSPRGRGSILAIASQTAVSGIRGSSLQEIEIDVPDVEEQKRIASVLATFDNLIEYNTKRTKILEEMAQLIYREWFIHYRYPNHEKVKMVDSGVDLGKIPEGWSINTLNGECELVMGQSPSSEYYNEIGEGLPFHQGVSDYGDRFPEDRVFCKNETRLAEARDILFSVRAPVGRLNITKKRIVIGRGLSAIRSKKGHQEFIFQQLKEIFKNEDSIGGGTIFKAVTKKDMQDIGLFVPPKEIVDQFTEIVRPIYRLLEVLDDSMVRLRKTRDLLLPSLISGQLSAE